MIPSTTVRFRNHDKVTVEIEGVRYPGEITNTYGDGTYFAKLADGTLTGQISETRLQPATILRNNDRIRVVSARHQNHTVRTLSDFGYQYGDYAGPEGLAKYISALERNSGKAVWLNAEAVVISAYREAPVARIDVTAGESVWLDSVAPGEGGWYVVTLPGRMDGDSSQLVRPVA